MSQKHFGIALWVAVALSFTVFTACEKEEFITTATEENNTESAILADDELHVCIDKHIESGKSNLEKAALISTKLWTVGQTIRVRFLGGDAFLQGKVMQYAKVWEEFANIKFTVVTSGTAEIRVDFEEGGSWSYFGKDAMYLGQEEATMNFGWFTSKTSDQEFRRTTLHEFGHALGMIHEHQHPVAGIPWDTVKVYEYYFAAPNNWTREDVQDNLFERYNTSQTQFCQYDAKSIMHYSVPQAHTVGDFQVGNNTVLSDEDKSFIGKLYPFTGIRSRVNNCNNIWYTASSGTGTWQNVKTVTNSLSKLAFGDFNGDRKTDAFRVNTIAGQWEIAWSGSGDWLKLQSSTVPLSELKFGDFNGDRKTDIFRNANSRWEVSASGLSTWTVLNNINVAVKDVWLADFNADGKTDIFYINSNRTWQISWSGTSSWQTLNSAYASNALADLAFGDFNGDRKTDVFRVNAGKWEVSWSGTSAWQTLNTLTTPAVTALAFQDFDGDGKTDVLQTTGSAWQISWSGITAWQNLRTSVQTISQLAFGDFNGDGKADVLNIR